jgi:DNA-binding FrmR family transcriptional regulator
MNVLGSGVCHQPTYGIALGVPSMRGARGGNRTAWWHVIPPKGIVDQKRNQTMSIPDTDHTTPYGYTADKDAYLKRLRRIEGQVRGIARMVEEDQYCIDILTQVAAVNKALHAVSLGLLEDHISHCVVGAAQESQASGNDDAVQEKVQEATAAIGRLLR